MSSFYIKLGSGQGSGSGSGLTDAELRASPVPVDLGAAVVNITGPVTIPGEVEVKNDAGSPLNVVAASLPLPAGASTLAEQQIQTTELNNIETEIQSANISLASIDGHIDGVEASLSSIDSKLTAPLTVAGTVAISTVPLTGSTPSTGAVTTVSSTVVPSNPLRKGLVIVNLSATRVFLAFSGNAAVANRGIMLVNGGSYSMDELSFTTGAVQAITASGTSNLSIQEYT